MSATAIEIGSKEKSPLAKTVRTCRKLLKVEAALWTFVYQDNAHGQSFFEISRAFCLGFPHSILSGGSTRYATSFSNSYCSPVSYTKP